MASRILEPAPVVRASPLIELPHALSARDGAPLVLTEVLASGRRGAERSAGAILLVHGFAQNRSAYLEGTLPAALLARGFAVFVAELRGHGRSRREGEAYEHALADHLHADLPAILETVCERAGVERATLVGHSMGGMLGYALLPSARRLGGLVTLGAAVALGRGRPVLRATARLTGPLVRRAPRSELPIDRLLAALAPLVARPPRRLPLPTLRELMRLANPREADAEAVQRILGGADPASRVVLAELIDMVESGRPWLGGVDLEAAVAGAELPVVAVVGGRDIFASRAAVEPILAGPGLRRIVEWPEAAHVDLTMGRRTEELAALIAEVAHARS